MIATTLTLLRNHWKNQQKEPTPEAAAAKARVRNAKALTLLFNKLRTKIGILEPLAPTWSWVCNVDKNDKVEEEADKPEDEAKDGIDEDTFIDRTAATEGNVE